MLELAELVIEATGSQSKMVFLPLPQDDPTRRRPDIHLAKEKLDWSPTVSVKDGLARTITYFDELLSGNIPPEHVHDRYLEIGQRPAVGAAL